MDKKALASFWLFLFSTLYTYTHRNDGLQVITRACTHTRTHTRALPTPPNPRSFCRPRRWLETGHVLALHELVASNTPLVSGS